MHEHLQRVYGAGYLTKAMFDIADNGTPAHIDSALSVTSGTSVPPVALDVIGIELSTLFARGVDALKTISWRRVVESTVPIGSFLQEVYQLFQKLVDAGVSATKKLLTRLKRYWGDFWNWLKSLFVDATNDDVTNMGQESESLFMSYLSAGWDALTRVVPNVIKVMWSVVEYVAEFITDVVCRMTLGTLTLIGTLANTVSEALKDARHKAKQICAFTLTYYSDCMELGRTKNEIAYNRLTEAYSRKTARDASHITSTNREVLQNNKEEIEKKWTCPLLFELFNPDSYTKALQWLLDYGAWLWNIIIQNAAIIARSFVNNLQSLRDAASMAYGPLFEQLLKKKETEEPIEVESPHDVPDFGAINRERLMDSGKAYSKLRAWSNDTKVSQEMQKYIKQILTLVDTTRQTTLPYEHLKNITNETSDQDIINSSVLAAEYMSRITEDEDLSPDEVDQLAMLRTGKSLEEHIVVEEMLQRLLAETHFTCAYYIFKTEIIVKSDTNRKKREKARQKKAEETEKLLRLAKIKEKAELIAAGSNGDKDSDPEEFAIKRVEAMSMSDFETWVKDKFNAKEDYTEMLTLKNNIYDRMEDVAKTYKTEIQIFETRTGVSGKGLTQVQWLTDLDEWYNFKYSVKTKEMQPVDLIDSLKELAKLDATNAILPTVFKYCLLREKYNFLTRHINYYPEQKRVRTIAQYTYWIIIVALACFGMWKLYTTLDFSGFAPKPVPVPTCVPSEPPVSCRPHFEFPTNTTDLNDPSRIHTIISKNKNHQEDTYIILSTKENESIAFKLHGQNATDAIKRARESEHTDTAKEAAKSAVKAGIEKFWKEKVRRDAYKRASELGLGEEGGKILDQVFGTASQHNKEEASGWTTLFKSGLKALKQPVGVAESVLGGLYTIAKEKWGLYMSANQVLTFDKLMDLRGFTTNWVKMLNGNNSWLIFSSLVAQTAIYAVLATAGAFLFLLSYQLCSSIILAIVLAIPYVGPGKGATRKHLWYLGSTVLNMFVHFFPYIAKIGFQIVVGMVLASIDMHQTTLSWVAPIVSIAGTVLITYAFGTLGFLSTIASMAGITTTTGATSFFSNAVSTGTSALHTGLERRRTDAEGALPRAISYIYAGMPSLQVRNAILKPAVITLQDELETIEDLNSLVITETKDLFYTLESRTKVGGTYKPLTLPDPPDLPVVDERNNNNDTRVVVDNKKKTSGITIHAPSTEKKTGAVPKKTVAVPKKEEPYVEPSTEEEPFVSPRKLKKKEPRKVEKTTAYDVPRLVVKKTPAYDVPRLPVKKTPASDVSENEDEDEDEEADRAYKMNILKKYGLIQ